MIRKTLKFILLLIGISFTFLVCAVIAVAIFGNSTPTHAATLKQSEPVKPVKLGLSGALLVFALRTFGSVIPRERLNWKIRDEKSVQTVNSVCIFLKKKLAEEEGFEPPNEFPR